MLGAGIPEAVREGYHFNLPERAVPGAAEVAPLVTVDDDAVVVSAAKLADDRSGDVVVRLYEGHGARTRAILRPGFALARVAVTDLLERPVEDSAAHTAGPDGAVALTLRPFQILTLRLTPARA